MTDQRRSEWHSRVENVATGNSRSAAPVWPRSGCASTSASSADDWTLPNDAGVRKQHYSKLKTHDSSQALLPSPSIERSNGKHRDDTSRDRQQVLITRSSPMWRGYCLWLTTILLVLVILPAALYVIVLRPIMDRSPLKKSHPISITPPNHPRTSMSSTTGHSDFAWPSKYGIVATTGKPRTPLIHQYFYSIRPTSTYPSTIALSSHTPIPERKTTTSSNIYNQWPDYENNFENVPTTRKPITSTSISAMSKSADTTQILTSITKTSTTPTTMSTRITTEEKRNSDKYLSSTTKETADDRKFEKINQEGRTKPFLAVNKKMDVTTMALSTKKATTIWETTKTPLRTTTKTSILTTKNNHDDKEVLKINSFVFENDDEIKPVEISIIPGPEEFSMLIPPPMPPRVDGKHGSAKTYYTPADVGEPVWRRLPPNFAETVAQLPPLPSPPVTMRPLLSPFQPSVSTLPQPTLPFSISASVVTVKNSNYDLKPDQKPKTNIRKGSYQTHMQRQRQRREAPVIVSALLDIGRGEWPHFTRHFDTYLDYFEKLFRLDNFMIIYCESKALEFIRKNIPDIDPRRLQVVELRLADLPLYRHRDEMQEILDGEQRDWSPQWDAQMRTHPEALYADYDVLVNSKAYLLNNATYISRFGAANDLFIWLDAGYGHGSPDVIPQKLWNPVVPPSQITVIKLTTVLEKVEGYTLSHVYRKRKVVISGGILAGGVTAIRRFNTFFFKTFMELLDSRHVDDDQVA